jgi:hypothetical protein
VPFFVVLAVAVTLLFATTAGVNLCTPPTLMLCFAVIIGSRAMHDVQP